MESKPYPRPVCNSQNLRPEQDSWQHALRVGRCTRVACKLVRGPLAKQCVSTVVRCALGQAVKMRKDQLCLAMMASCKLVL